MKRIIDHRSAKQKSYLVARHAQLDLVEILLLDQVSLGDVQTINAAAGRGKRAKNNCDEQKSVHNRRASYLLAKQQNSQIVSTRISRDC